jgi:hypothetical protein
MNPNEKELLEKTYEMSKENNHILRGIRSSNRWATIFKIFYWVIIIGVSVGAFYYIQPYIDIATKTYKSVQGDLGSVKSLINNLPKAN